MCCVSMYQLVGFYMDGLKEEKANKEEEKEEEEEEEETDIISDILLNLNLVEIDKFDTSKGCIDLASESRPVERQGIAFEKEKTNASVEIDSILTQNAHSCSSSNITTSNDNAFCMCDENGTSHDIRYDENPVICDVCPYCQLLRCDSNILKQKPNSSSYKYFDDAVTQSHNLLEESVGWITNMKSPKLTNNFSAEIIDNTLLVPGNNFSEVLLLEFVVSNDVESKQLLEGDVIVTDLESTGDYRSVFNELPNELKLRIFSYFTQRELCCYIAPVCSTWFNLSKDPSLWLHIYTAEFEDVQSDILVNVIVSWCKQLTYLELNRRSEITLAEFHNIFQSCPHLKHISFAFCTQVNNEILNLMSTHCKSIHSINMEGCGQITDQSFYSFVGLLLDRVCVSHCNQLSDEGGIFLARNFNHLVEVDFDGIQWMTEEFVQVLVENHYESLEKVYLDGENLTDDSVRLFSRCLQLRTLSFSFCTAMTHHALEWVGQCTKLNHLKMRKGANFTNASLLKYLQNMSDEQAYGYKYLNLSECTEISDECLFYVGEKCKSLQVLDLSWCWEVSDDGLAFIIDNCHELKELHLRGLHELYGIPFSKIITSLPKLTFLDLSQCNKVQDELIECVVQKVKTLVILNYYGDVVVNVLHRRAHLLT